MINHPSEEEFVLEKANFETNSWRVWQKSYDKSPGLNPYRYFRSEKAARQYIDKELKEVERVLRMLELGWNTLETFKVRKNRQ